MVGDRMAAVPDSSPQISDVRAAAQRLRGVVRTTPALPDEERALAAGLDLVVKCENLQRTGSFKVRGISNHVIKLDPDRRAQGLVTLSAGNTGIATALAARLAGVPATVVMPGDAVGRKVRAIAALGAETVLVERRAELEERLEQLVAERSLAYVPSYDDPAVIAGQGTVALELLAQVPDLEALIVPTGGGGLLAGCAVVLRALRPQVRLFAAEAAGAAKLADSIEAGRLVRRERVETIADGLATSEYGVRTFALVRDAVERVLVVPEPEILAAMAHCWDAMRLAVEPSSAVALAALPHLAGELEGRRVAVVLTGGNVEPSRLTEALRAEGR